MAFDALLQLLGATGDPTETVSSTGASDNEVFIGAGRRFMVEMRVGGAADGTTPTLDMKLQEATAQGGSYTDVQGGAFAQLTDTDYLKDRQGTTPHRIVVQTTKDWVRAYHTIGGTNSPAFHTTSCQILDLTDQAVEALGA